MEQTKNEYRCLTKCELAEKCGVSVSTIREWLNIRYYPELKKMGYQKDQKILLPPQVKFIIERLVVIEE